MHRGQDRLGEVYRDASIILITKLFLRGIFAYPTAALANLQGRGRLESQANLVEFKQLFQKMEKLVLRQKQNINVAQLRNKDIDKLTWGAGYLVQSDNQEKGVNFRK